VRDVALIGFMATGKSTLARHLARRLGLPLIVLDERIGRRAGRSVERLFAEEGEDRFRVLESEALLSLENEGPHVLDCGGGVVVRGENRRFLRKRYRVVLLEVEWGRLWGRLCGPGGPGRPLLEGGSEEEARRLLEGRRPLYRATAHHVLDAGGEDPQRLARRVLEAR
jgi:shikimate kinase